jgi:hypothetical protein
LPRLPTRLKVDGYIAALNDYDSFRQAIINERAWEFGGECIRKFDLIRWNYYSDAIVNSIEWIIRSAVNAQQLKLTDGELIYDKNLPIEDLHVANALYFTFRDGKVQFENDLFTARDAKEEPYKSAETIKDDAIGAGYTSDKLYRVDFAKSFISVSDTDESKPDKPKYGTDPTTGDPIKKGVVAEKVLYSWYGLTDGVLINGTEDLSSLRQRPTPYVMPIPSSKISASNGVLSNNGYAIRNK